MFCIHECAYTGRCDSHVLDLLVTCKRSVQCNYDCDFRMFC